MTRAGERSEGERAQGEAGFPADIRQLTEVQDPITLGTFECSPRAREYVNDVLDTGRLTYGPYSQRFEREFARIHDCEFAVLSSSGTSALHMALAAMKELHGWADGDEVIVPSVTFVATVNIVLHCHMTPVLVDVEPTYYELDPEKLEAAITARTRAMIPVHLFGQPSDMAPITEIAARHDVKIIEDSCETMFARYHGKSCGALGDIGCFSTYVAHLLVTGVGGINTTNDRRYAELLRSLANHGRDNIYTSIDDDDSLEDDRMRQVIARRFRFTSVGFSNRITELEAALGVAALETYQDMVAHRRKNAAHLIGRLASVEEHVQLPAIREQTEHSFMMMPLVVRHEPKQKLVEALEFAGVETRDMLPLTNQPVLQKALGITEEDFPVAKWINDSGFYVGCHQDLGISHMNDLAGRIEEFYGGT